MKTVSKYLFFMFFLSGIVFAGGGEFFGSVDNDWWNGGNWTGGAAPVSGENGWISADAVVGSGNATFDWCYVGWTNDGSVTVNSGAQFNVYATRIGNVGGGGLANGSMTIEGYYSAWGDTIVGEYGSGSMVINGNGVVDMASYVFYLGCNNGTTGYLELNDNASLTTSWLLMDGYYWSGNPASTHVQLNGGTLTAGGIGMFGTNGDWDGATIDFDGGTFVIAGDYVDTAYWLEGNGSFTSGNGIVATYDDGLDQTFISEIPEPATMVLLSLGGIFVSRRKRK